MNVVARYIGMPVPAHALFWASAGYSLAPLAQVKPVLFIVVTLVVALATSLLLVSEIPMFSLKIKSVAWKGNERRYILVGCAVLFVALFGMLGIAEPFSYISGLFLTKDSKQEVYSICFFL